MIRKLAVAEAGPLGQPRPDRPRRTVLPLQPRLSPGLVPGARPGPRRSRGRVRPVSLEGQVCGLFAVDIVGFSEARRDDDIRVYVHRSLYDMLEAAFDQSGLPWHECAHEDRGDGVLVVIPPGISVAGLVHPLPDKLLTLVRRHNRVSVEAARIQLRVASHIGPVQYDGYGFVGHDFNLLHRMLDAPAFKRILKASGAELAFIASDYLYENVVARRPSLAGPAVFKPLMVRVKETRARAWAYTLGGPAPAPETFRASSAGR